MGTSQEKLHFLSRGNPIVNCLSSNYKKMRVFLLILGLLMLKFSFAQPYSQTIRGSISDKILNKPIAMATVQVVGTEYGTQSDAQGQFQFPKLPVGTYHLLISAVGFKTYQLPQVLLNAGKEVVLSIQLEEEFKQVKEIKIKGGRKKNSPLNELSMVSARVFSVEETQKYAAAVNDPARMATNFPGVQSGDDGNNQIVIRGNSPSGLLWRMEGIDIPNPNHFAVPGSSGGGISILSTQLLSNSDFITGAFAAEYGNALSGVFDLRLRKGNNQHREYALQAGLLGLNIAAEGPFRKGYEGSYLINYRYSTLSLLNNLGLNLTPFVTNFQDYNYHLVLPTRKAGTFSLFGFGGWSNQFYQAKKDSSLWKTSEERYNDDFYGNTFVNAVAHSIHLGERHLLKTNLALSSYRAGYQRSYTENDYSTLRLYNQGYRSSRLTLNTSLNTKLSSRFMLRSGLQLNHYQFRFDEEVRPSLQGSLDTVLDMENSTQTAQVYSQLQWKAHAKISATLGLHSLYLHLNQHYALEPRAAVRYELHPRHTFTLGYGLHSQMQSWGVYYALVETPQGTSYPNKNLAFSKAHHAVLAYQFAVRKNLRLKTEFYYQQLFSVPVSVYDSSRFSAINMSYDMVRMPLRNKGLGRNYGVEISLERYLDKGFYYLMTTSLYQSEYRANNGQWYNSRYNGNRLANVVAGKDFVSASQRRTFGLNIRAVYAGGYRSTPINTVASQQRGETIYEEDRSYRIQLPDYFRADLRLSMKWNRSRRTSTLSLDIQNVSNRKNIYDRYFDVNTGEVKTWYQTGIIPVLNYKIEF